MAVVKSPLFSEEAHGPLGGIEYRTCRGRNVVGRRSISTALATPAQLQHRSLLKLAHAAWSRLPLSSQAAWDAIAPAPLTGRNEYVARWIRCKISAADPPQPNPPSLPIVLIDSITLNSATIDPPEIAIGITAADAANEMIMFFAHSTFSHRENPTIRQMTLVGYTGMTSAGWSWTPRVIAPVVHFLATIVDARDGTKLGSQLWRFEPVWS
jgi:hypothetical protein